MDSQVGKVVFVAGAIVVVLMGGVFVVFFQDEDRNLLMSPLAQFTVTSNPNDTLASILQNDISNLPESSSAISGGEIDEDVGSSVSFPTMISNSLTGIGGGVGYGEGAFGSGGGSSGSGSGGSGVGSGGSGSGGFSGGGSLSSIGDDGDSSSGQSSSSQGSQSLLAAPPSSSGSSGSGTGNSLLAVPPPVVGSSSSSSGGGSAPVIRHNPELPPGMLGYFGFALSGIVYWLRRKFKI